MECSSRCFAPATGAAGSCCGLCSTGYHLERDRYGSAGSPRAVPAASRRARSTWPALRSGQELRTFAATATRDATALAAPAAAACRGPDTACRCTRCTARSGPPGGRRLEGSPGTARGRPPQARRQGCNRQAAGASTDRCPPARRTPRRSRRVLRRRGAGRPSRSRRRGRGRADSCSCTGRTAAPDRRAAVAPVRRSGARSRDGSPPRRGAPARARGRRSSPRRLRRRRRRTGALRRWRPPRRRFWRAQAPCGRRRAGRAGRAAGRSRTRPGRRNRRSIRCPRPVPRGRPSRSAG